MEPISFLTSPPRAFQRENIKETSPHKTILGSTLVEEEQATIKSSWLSGSIFEQHPQFGSLTSLSSVKSTISAISIKSDSGAILRKHKETDEDGEGQNKGKRGFRDWVSESQLGKGKKDSEKKEKKMKPDINLKNLASSLGAINKQNRTRSLGALFR